MAPNLASEISESDLSFKSFIPKITTTLNETNMTEEEFSEAFKSLKRNKAPGSDGL